MESTTLPTYFTTLNYEYPDEYETYINLLYSRMNTPSIVAYSLVFVLGTIGNRLVTFITGFRMKKTVNTVWILNLAIADFTFTFFLPLSIVHIGLEFHWPFGHIMCKLNSTIVFFCLFTSIYFLVVISIDRCISVWCPVWARNHRTPQLASFVVLGIWIMNLVLCSPILYFRDSYPDNYTSNTYCFSNYGEIDKGGRRTQYTLVLIRFIIGFIIPFSVIVVCYGAIVLKFRRDHSAQSNKPYKVITAVIVAFFVCWLPFHIFSLLVVEIQDEAQWHLVLLVGFPLASCLTYFNSCLNPILYFCMGGNFKEKLRCSLLSALETAFTEEGDRHTMKTTAKSCAELEPRSL